MILFIPSRQRESDESKMLRGSIEYSNNISEQKAFMAGCKYWLGDDLKCPGIVGFFIYTLFLLLIIANFIGFVGGASDVFLNNKYTTAGKWEYIVPTRKAAFYFFKWMEK